MQCPAAETLRSYLDGSLDPALTQSIRAHLKQCSTCASKSETLQQINLDHSSSASQSKPIFSEAELPGRYQPLGEIGRGGMGLVLRVHDGNLNRPLALKTLVPKSLNAEGIRRFEREAEITGSLQHPGVPPVVEFAHTASGCPFFTMKVVEGDDLASLLRRRKSPTEDCGNLLNVFEQVAQTLAFAHQRGVIHRDLKPHNVMVGEFGEVQVMDWGTARRLDCATDDSENLSDSTVFFNETSMDAESDDGDSLTREGQIMGTIAYMPPEQACGDIEHLDCRSDVFGLGSLLCEILTGAPPYTGASAKTLLTTAMSGDTSEAVSRLDACQLEGELRQLCKDCLATDPNHRPANAGEVSDRITAFLQSVQDKLQRAKVDEAAALVKADEERKRRRIVVLTAPIVVGLLAIVGWFVAQQRMIAQAAVLEKQSEQAIESAKIHALLDRVAEARDESAWERAKIHLAAAEQLVTHTTEDAAKQRARESRIDLEAAEGMSGLPIRIFEGRASVANLKGRDGIIAAELKKYLDLRFGIKKNILDLDDGELDVLRTSPILSNVIDTLDDWGTGISVAGKKVQEEVFAVASRLDPDPEAARIRDLYQNHKTEELTSIAAKMIVERSRPQLVKMVGEATISQNGGVGRGLLELSTLAHPEVFYNWITAARSSRSDESLEVEFYRAAIAAHPQVTALYHNLGVYLVSAKRAREALVFAEYCIRKFPNEGRHHSVRGSALEQLGDIKGAEQAFRKAAAVSQDRGYESYQLASFFARQKRIEEAEAAYREAIHSTTTSTSPLISFVRFLRGQNRKGEAVQLVDEYLANPKIDHYFTYLMVRYLREEKWPELSAVVSRHHVAKEPSSARGWQDLGYYRQESGDLQGAIEAYEQRLKLKNPTSATFNNLGLIYFKREDHDNAIATYQKGIATAKPSHYIHHNLGRALQATERYEEAIQSFERAFQLEGKQAELLQIAECQQLLGDKPARIKTLTRIVDAWDKRHHATRDLASAAIKLRSLAAYDVAFRGFEKLAVAYSVGSKYRAYAYHDQARTALHLLIQAADDVKKTEWRATRRESLENSLNAWRRYLLNPQAGTEDDLKKLNAWRIIPEFKKLAETEPVLPEDEESSAWRDLWNQWKFVIQILEAQTIKRNELAEAAVGLIGIGAE